MSLRISRTIFGAPSRLAPLTRPTLRSYSSPSAPITEETIRAKLAASLETSELRVVDTSGGCGSFFNIDIVSKAFNGMNKVKQQRMVNAILKRELPDLHGISMRTVAEDEVKK